MIYFTTFILALFFSQIAHAVPACGDIILPESPTPVDQFNFPIAAATVTAVVTHNIKYDNRSGEVKATACSRLAAQHPWFYNFPTFPRIGGAFDIPPSSNCGLCWKLTNLNNNISIIITAIDHANHGFVLSQQAFKLLSGGPLVPELYHVEYLHVPQSFCGL
jgi:hypothetical protein